MTRFYIMRHGETEWNRDGNRFCGRSDILLSELGQQQSAQTALFLQKTAIDLIYTSNLQRAIATAAPVAEQKALVIQQDERITEIDFGHWDGILGQQIRQQFPDDWQQWVDDPTATAAGVTGENAAQVFARMNRFFVEKSLEHPNKNVLVVSHSTAIRIYIAGVLSMPFRSYRLLAQGNTGISIMESGKENMSLLQFNCRYDTFTPGSQSLSATGA
jgi:uncharacterized phosphatase